MELYLYWLMHLSGVFTLFAFNYGLLSYYTDPHETVRVTMLIQMFALSSVLVYILLIPFDVFATVRHYETLFQLTVPVVGYKFAIRIYDLYFLCYVGMIYLCFIGLPFSYFYAQSVQDEDDMIIQEQANLLAAQKQRDQSAASSDNMTPEETPAEEDLPNGQQEKTYKFAMKGMDSSDSEDEADAEKSSRRQQADPQSENTMQDQDQPGESDQLMGNGASAQQMSIKSSSKRSSYEKFMAHSKKAFKKTVCSFVCLSVMMLLSFVVSTYEINQIENTQLMQAKMINQTATNGMVLNTTELQHTDEHAEESSGSHKKGKKKHGKSTKMKKSKHSKKSKSHKHQKEEEDEQEMDENVEVQHNDHAVSKNGDHFNIRKINVSEVLTGATHLTHKLVDTVKKVNYTALTDMKNYDNWKKQVLDSSQYGEPFLRFTLTAIMTVGAVFNLVYLSYGMAGLPIYLIKGTKSLESENTEITGSIQQVRERLRSLQEKYARSQRTHISAKDKQTLQKLRREERILNNKQLRITTHIKDNEAADNTCWQIISVILKLLTPFRVAVGAACLVMSALLIYSLMVNNIDRLIHSECGMKCGYILEKSPQYFNPLDQLLLRLSSHHEKYFDVQLFLDTSLFASMLVYVFICTLYGIIKIGINFFSLELFKIRRRDSTPQALSIVSILVILMMFAFSMNLMSIAPQYLTFGDQRLPSDGNTANNTLEKCTLKMSQLTHMVRDADGNLHQVGFGCQMTMIAQLYNKMQLSLPLSCLIYFMLSWAFTAFFILFAVYHGYYKKNYMSQYLNAGYSAASMNDEDGDEEEDQDDDLQNFIQEKLSQAAAAASATQASLAEKIKNDRWEAREEQRCWDNQSVLSNSQ